MSALTDRCRSALRAVFERGYKPRSQWRLGMERERVVMIKDGLKPLPFRGAVSIQAIFKHLIERFGWQADYLHGELLALKRDGAQITLEPAGQVEWSGAPYATIQEIEKEQLQWEEELATLPFAQQLRWLQGGLNPLHSIQEVEWVPKERYQLMRIILPRQEKLGLKMMSLTTSIQVSIDFESEKDAHEKLRASAALVPLFSALYANSPIHQGRKSGFVSYRSHIWLHTDPHRCSVQPFMFRNTPDIFNHYLDYALQVPMFFKQQRLEGQQHLIDAQDQTFSQHLHHHLDDAQLLEDWDLHLSTLFTETRLKHYLELRTPDGNLTPLAMSFAALCRALLYHDDARHEVWSMLKRFSFAERQSATASAAARGLSGSKFGKFKMLDLARELYGLAEAALRDLDQRQGTQDSAYLIPLAVQIFHEKRSPGEKVLEYWDRRWFGRVDQLIEFLSRHQSAMIAFDSRQ